MELTPFRKHVENWIGCTRCPLCDDRENVVLARGNIPADLLLLGEAPGYSEDEFGKPFVGPAGKVLDQIIVESLKGTNLRACISNIIACIPKDEDGVKVGKPPADSVIACTPRVVDLVRICQPKLIVCVGSIPADWINPPVRDVYTISNQFERQIPTVEIVHPSWILRQDFAQRNRLVIKQVVTIRTKVDQLLENPEKFANSVSQEIDLPSRMKQVRRFSEDDIPF